MSAKEDLERTNELKARVWARVAKNISQGEKTPYQIKDTKVEDHRGRRGKAVRLLGNVLSVAVSKTSAYSRDPDITYAVNRFDESKEIGTPPEFLKTWQEYHKEIFSSGYDEQADFEILGYRSMVRDLNDAQILYVHWHPEEYDTITHEEVKYYYPKALQETRTKAILRAIVEHHFQEDFPRKLEKYLDLPKEALKDEGEFKIEPRNFAAYASSFTREMYTGTGGFLEEYTHYRKYFEGLTQHLNTIDRMVEEKGGHAVMVREMRIDSIQQLLMDAPLHINYVSPDKSTDYDKEKKNERSKVTSVYLLRHSDYFDYDILYAEDTTIEHINGYHVVNAVDSNYVFKPTEDTIKVVTNIEKGRRVCLAQMISGILPITSKTVPTT